MRSASTALAAWLDATTAADAPRHLVTVTLRNGSVYYWTDHETDLVVGANTFLAGGMGTTVPVVRVGKSNQLAGADIASLALTLECGARETKLNRLTRSQEFDHAAWTKTALTVTANATTAPDGTSTADKLVESATLAIHHVFQADAAAPVIGDNETATVSVYAKAAERSWIQMRIRKRDGSDTAWAWFNLATGSVGSGTVTTGYTATTTDAGGGWFRCTLAGSVASGSFTAGLRLVATTGNGVASYTGDGTSGLYVWGAQLETGDAVSVHIPTTSDPVTATVSGAMLGTKRLPIAAAQRAFDGATVKVERVFLSMPGAII